MDAGNASGGPSLKQLPLVFGPYFALKLARAGQGPTGAGGVVGFAILGLIVTLLGMVGQALGDFRLAILVFGVSVMFFAIFGNWGTHYDSPAPQFPPSSHFGEWLLTGVIPQLTLWIAHTVIWGMVAGGVAVALMGKRAPATA